MVAACHETSTPWVARGAGSGLSGGALPVEEGVLIALTRMRRILDVNLDDSRVTVEPGVTNIEVSNAVSPTHTYPPDPSSQIVCSIGGNVAENSGGAHCFKYGFTTNYVTGPRGRAARRRDDVARRQRARPRRPGRDRRLRGLGGHAGRGHQGDPARHPRAGGGPHAGGLLRLPHPRGRGGVGDRLRGHRAGGDRDDGQPLDPGRRGRHQRRIPHRRRARRWWWS